MTKTSFITDQAGKVVGVRDTSDDGKQSLTYEYGGPGILGTPTRGECVDVTEHNADGTSKSYEYGGRSIFGTATRGKAKD